MRVSFLLTALCFAVVTSGCSNLSQQPRARNVEVLFKKADTDGDGRVSREEFAEFMVEDVFTNFDRNRSGYVDEAEFVAAGGTVKNFRTIDRDGNGRIALEEAKASKLVRETMLTPFDEADVDGSGYVTWEEFQAFRKRAAPYIR